MEKKSLLSGVLIFLSAMVFSGTIILLMGGREVIFKKAGDNSLFGGDIFTLSRQTIDEDNNATSTVTYFNNSDIATSTWTVYTSRADSVDLNMQFNASSTLSKLVWHYEFSNNNIDWYNEDVNTTSGSDITHGAATTTHSWTPGNAGIHRKNIRLSSLASKYLRISFNTDDGAGSVWTQAILHEPF